MSETLTKAEIQVLRDALHRGQEAATSQNADIRTAARKVVACLDKVQAGIAQLTAECNALRVERDELRERLKKLEEGGSA